MNIHNDVTIDSLKVRIPLNKVKIINPAIGETWGEVSSNGELSSLEFKHKRFTHKSAGATTSYLIQKRKCDAYNNELFLIILFNAKLLGSHYFQGIHSKNINFIYSIIQAQGHALFSFDDFINGAVTDCDIKRDFPTTGKAHQEQIVKGFKALTKLSASKSKGCTVGISEKIVIIQWSKRDTATQASPHVKFYSKDLELQHQSNVFKMEHDLSGDSVLRLEATIKDRDHFRHLIGSRSKNQTFTLYDLFSLSPEKMIAIINSMLHKHIEAPIGAKDKAQFEGINLSEAFCLAIIGLNNFKLSKHEIIIHCSKFTADKYQQARAKKMILKLWPDDIDTEYNRYTDNIYRFVFGG